MSLADRIVGIDPGSNASGVAIYERGVLVALRMMTLAELGVFIAKNDCAYAIEDVSAIRPLYHRNDKGNRRVASRIAQNVGQVKQTGKHIIEMLDLHQRRYRAIRPQAGNWGTLKPRQGSAVLALRTGWDGASNKDTRAAAFFGWLALKTGILG